MLSYAVCYRVNVFLNRTVRPPTPPPPELGQVLLQMTQMLGQMQQTQHSYQQVQQGNGRVTIRDFLQLNPRSFDSTPEPLDADDWVRDVNRMLNTAGVTLGDKVRFATHLLKGGSAAWWENFLEMCPAKANVTWEEFVEAFRSHHIPEGLMDRMKEKFCNLVQGNRDVVGYSIEFARLARYAGEKFPLTPRSRRGSAMG